MKPIAAYLLGACLLLCYCGLAQARNQPYITGQISAPECVDSINFAKQVYTSASPYLYAPIEIPHGLNSIMILGTTNVDISGGDALDNSDRGHFSNPFSEVRNLNLPRTYWGKDISNGVRLVVTAEGYGWRGDMYSLYALPERVTPQQFKDALAPHAPGQEQYKSILQGSWRPPFVFWSKITHRPWFIVVGGTYELGGAWWIYLDDEDTSKASCVVHFWPSLGSNSAPLALPEKVKYLKKLLDETMGHDSTGPLSGTMHPIAALTMESAHVWLNVAYRPWALSDKDAYNSRERADAGLLDWSHNGPAYEKLYFRIQRAYPLAQSALATYYESHFGLPKASAKHVAKWVLDIAFRATFSFSGGTPSYMKSNDANPNPWNGAR